MKHWRPWVPTAILVMLGACGSPRWEVADSDRLTIPAGQAYIDEVHPAENFRVRVTLREGSAVPVVAFWLTPEQHEQAQSSLWSDGLDQAMEANTFVRGRGSEVVGETTIPGGSHYLYFQQDIDASDAEVDLDLEYVIEAFR